jgi:cytochrome d ubiquinol oxidase subunit I
MTNFGALLTNPNVWVQFPHTVLAGFSTGAFFVMGISAYHLIRKKDIEVFKPSFQIANVYGAISILLVILVGHNQAQYMVKSQPMKMAAAEALVETQNPAPLSIFTIVDQNTLKETVSLRIPMLLSVLSYNQFSGEVKGMVQLQEELAQKYGPGNYIPNIAINYWAFRIMVGAGFLMLFMAALGLFYLLRNKPFEKSRFVVVFPFAIGLPYLANSFGWILTEMGRQPWVVYGLKKTADAFSPNLNVGMVLTSLIIFILIYGVLMVADVYLLVKYAKAGPQADHVAGELTPEKGYWG